MLKGVPSLLSPELMAILMRMGHGDDLVIADGNFPAETMGKRLVRVDGHGALAVVDAILKFLPLDDFVDDPVKVMNPVDPAETDPPIWSGFQELIDRHEERSIPLKRLERFEFYRQAQEAFAVVATSETAIYGNLILKKGVVRI